MPPTRLATYGTLAPGRSNHGQLSALSGTWEMGTVKGRLMDEGWGAEEGYPGLVLDPDGDDVPVHLFSSDDLPDHRDRLDAFEGAGYTRRTVKVDVNGDLLEAELYTLTRD